MRVRAAQQCEHALYLHAVPRSYRAATAEMRAAAWYAPATTHRPGTDGNLAMLLAQRERGWRRSSRRAVVNGGAMAVLPRLGVTGQSQSANSVFNLQYVRRRLRVLCVCELTAAAAAAAQIPSARARASCGVQ